LNPVLAPPLQDNVSLGRLHPTFRCGRYPFTQSPWGGSRPPKWLKPPKGKNPRGPPPKRGGHKWGKIRKKPPEEHPFTRGPLGTQYPAGNSSPEKNGLESPLLGGNLEKTKGCLPPGPVPSQNTPVVPVEK